MSPCHQKLMSAKARAVQKIDDSVNMVCFENKGIWTVLDVPGKKFGARAGCE